MLAQSYCLITHLNWRYVADGELLPLLDKHLGLQCQMVVGEHHVVGVGDARVGGETERGEHGLERYFIQVESSEEMVVKLVKSKDICYIGV